MLASNAHNYPLIKHSKGFRAELGRRALFSPLLPPLGNIGNFIKPPNILRHLVPLFLFEIVLKDRLFKLFKVK